MAHRFEVLIEVQLERTDGEPASRDAVVDGIHDAFAGACEGESISGIGADGASEYDIVSSTVVSVHGVPDSDEPFTVTIEVELERVEGKFASRDAMVDELHEIFADVCEGDWLPNIGVDGVGGYQITSSAVVDVADGQKKGGNR